MIRMQPQRVESPRLLAWLSKMIRKGDATEVEIVVIDEPQGVCADPFFRRVTGG